MSATPLTAAVGTIVEPGGARRISGAGWWVMWRIETAKLGAQFRVRLAVVACVLGPVAFAVAERVQSGVPADTIFGRWVHESGYAVSFVILAFCGQWVLPILVSIVAGDMFTGEDRCRTWTLLLTRSRTRSDVVAGKVLASITYAVVVVVLLGASATVTGVVAVGTQPVVGLSGALLSSSQAFHAVVASWATVIAPTLAMVGIALLISAVSRNSWVGVMVPVVLVLALNLVSLLSSIDPVRPYLPTQGFEAWHGLARTGVYTSPLEYAFAVSAAWLLLCVIGVAAVVVRRDVVDA